MVEGSVGFHARVILALRSCLLFGNFSNMRTIMFWSVISRKLSLAMIVDVRAAGFDPFILLN